MPWKDKTQKEKMQAIIDEMKPTSKPNAMLLDRWYGIVRTDNPSALKKALKDLVDQGIFEEYHLNMPEVKALVIQKTGGVING